MPCTFSFFPLTKTYKEDKFSTNFFLVCKISPGGREGPFRQRLGTLRSGDDGGSGRRLGKTLWGLLELHLFWRISWLLTFSGRWGGSGRSFCCFRFGVAAEGGVSCFRGECISHCERRVCGGVHILILAGRSWQLNSGTRIVTRG
jgi:hypothetical protein